MESYKKIHWLTGYIRYAQDIKTFNSTSESELQVEVA